MFFRSDLFLFRSVNRGPLSSSRLSALPFFFWGPTPPLLVAVWMVEDESRGCWLEADRSGIYRRRCVGLLLVGYSGRPVCWWRREQLTNSGGCLCIQSRGGDREGRRAGEMKEGMGSVSSREDEGRNGQRRKRLDFLKEKAAATVLEK